MCHTQKAKNLDIYVIRKGNMGAWAHLTDLFPGVVGENWIILAPAGDDAARRVHEAVGGQLVISNEDGA